MGRWVSGLSSWPGSMARLSVLTAVKLASAPTRRPDSGSCNSLRRIDSSIGLLPDGQRPAGFLEIGERQAFAANFLIVLVTFAGQHDHIFRSRGRDPTGDCLRAAMAERDRKSVGEVTSV